jgi:hypothetical protein
MGNFSMTKDLFRIRATVGIAFLMPLRWLNNQKVLGGRDGDYTFHYIIRRLT